MTFLSSPSERYYLALYALVVIVRYFQIKKKSNPANPDIKRLTKQERMSVFHVGLEIAYTASGLVVLLLADLQTDTPFILIIYMIFLMATVQIDSMESKFSERTVFAANIFILVTAIVVTTWYFEVIYKDKHATLNPEGKPKISHFRVVIPYTDLALRDHIGNTIMGSKQFVYLAETDAINITEAKQNALKMGDEIPSFTSRKHPSKKPGDIVIVPEQVFVQQIE
ncbi:MAG: hypothetical protein WCZ86_07055 [Desulfurivibrionaceae bacterium]|jgi:hypothetical protein